MCFVNFTFRVLKENRGPQQGVNLATEKATAVIGFFKFDVNIIIIIKRMEG